MVVVVVAALGGVAVVVATAEGEAFAVVTTKLGVGGMPSTVVGCTGGVSSATSSMRASAAETAVSSQESGTMASPRCTTSTGAPASAVSRAEGPEEESSLKLLLDPKPSARGASSTATPAEAAGAGVASGALSKLGVMACSRGATLFDGRGEVSPWREPSLVASHHGAFHIRLGN